MPQKTGIMILLLAMIPIGLAQVGTPSGTNAWFSAEAAIDVGLATGTWGEKPPSPQPSGDLKLTPGDAKAVRPSQVPPGPACFPIASMDQSGNLKLDFGELPPGNTNNSPDVFRIKNEGDTPVELRIEGAEGFEGYVVRIRPGNEGSSVVLQPGEECSFDIKVGVAQGTVAGDRTGVIRISAVDGSCTVEIPALLTVVHEETGPDKEGGPMTGDKALSTPSDGADQTEGPGQDGTTATTVPGDPMGTTDQSVGLDGAAGQATQESQTTAPVTDVPPATSDPPNTSTPPVTDDPLGPG